MNKETYKKLTTPLTGAVVRKLRAGDRLLLSGEIYTARDAAHKKLDALIKHGKSLPFNLKGAAIYYAGPSPAKPGSVIGSAGPTTSSRMDVFTPSLLKLGLKGMIGKGKRSLEVLDTMKKYGAVYFAATGGAGALLSRKVIKCELVAYPELDPESIYRLEVREMPLIVAADMHGNSLYE
jgi:fumarate hydratase subunit beta